MHKVIPHNAVLVPNDAACVFEGAIFSVYQWPQEMFDGSTATFEMLRRCDTVSILAVKDGKLLTQTEEQPHLGTRFGVPAGRVDATDDSWLAAAQRECREETGFSFRNWRLVHVAQPYAKIEWFNAVFVAWDLETTQTPTHDPGEKINPALLSIHKAKQKFGKSMLLSGVTSLLAPIESVDELIQLPEFKGKEVER